MTAAAYSVSPSPGPTARRDRAAPGRVLGAGLLLFAAQAPATPPSDILMTASGDVHSGWIRAERLWLQTDYGRLELPSWMLRSLQFGQRAGEPDRATTVDGDRVHGRIEPADLEIERFIAAPLRVRRADIATVQFGPRQPPVASLTDAVEFVNGDVLRVQVLTPEWRLGGVAGSQSLSAAELRAVDLAAGDDGVQAQATTQRGQRVRGALETAPVAVRTRAGQVVELDPRVLETVAFGIAAEPSAAEQLPGLGHSGPGRQVERFRDRLRDGGPGPLLVVVAPGSYLRGDTQGDGDADEKPLALVTLGHAFAIGSFELTFDDYARFCQATGRAPPDDSGWGRGRRPAVNVSWEDARAYADWLSTETGHRYRLPTESEWEYAARAGSETRYWWGEDAGAGLANCADCGGLWDGVGTAPVGKFAANAFGLFDSAGNVWEWVQDCYDQSYVQVPVDGGALDPQACGKRVIRGGAWSFPRAEARSANRWRDFPSRHSDDTGFRVLREL